MTNDCRLFKSKYPDWSSNISGYMPKLNIGHDKCQLYANFMVLVAILGVLPISIQAWRVYQTKETQGISTFAFSFQIIISILWVCYALICRNGIIVISSSLIIIAAATLVFLVWYYKSVKEDVDES